MVLQYGFMFVFEFSGYLSLRDGEIEIILVHHLKERLKLVWEISKFLKVLIAFLREMKSYMIFLGKETT